MNPIEGLIYAAALDLYTMRSCTRLPTRVRLAAGVVLMMADADGRVRGQA